MNAPPEKPTEPGKIPLAQRVMDNPFLLLLLGLLVMFVFYTGWGVLEVLRLEQAPLP